MPYKDYNKKLEREASRRDERLRKGLCVDCGQTEHLSDSSRCFICKEKLKSFSLKSAEKRRERIKQGFCALCGNQRDGKNKTYCLKCLPFQRERATINARRTRNERFEKGICIECGIDSKLQTNKYCVSCWFYKIGTKHQFNRTEAKILQNIWEQQNKRCALSGDVIEPGLNMSLDHKIPPSRGGTQKLDNIQWCSKRINTMKSNMTVEEFIDLCKKVVQTNE